MTAGKPRSAALVDDSSGASKVSTRAWTVRRGAGNPGPDVRMQAQLLPASRCRATLER
jgi:hypothetical protein